MKVISYLILSILIFNFIGCVDTSNHNYKSKKQIAQEAAQKKRENANNPFYIPGICRLIRNQGKSPDGLFDPVKKELDESRVYAYSFGIYQLKNGEYVVARTMHDHEKYPNKYMKLNDPDLSYIRRYIARGEYLPSTRCTDGSDIALDTGKRIIKKGKKVTPLLAKLAIGAVKMVTESGHASSSTASNSGGSSSSFCGVNDTCFRLVERRSRGATVQCTKGYEIGFKKCIMVNKNGKWATGCGISDSTGHHYAFETAANKACGQ